MSSWCHCGHAIAYPLDDLGCIECGQACCHACGVSLESVTYCAKCAETLLQMQFGVAILGPE